MLLSFLSNILFLPSKFFIEAIPFLLYLTDSFAMGTPLLPLAPKADINPLVPIG